MQKPWGAHTAPVVKTLLKLGLAGILIFWMVHSGRLDLSAIGRAGTRWPTLLLIAGVFYCQIFIMSLRWRLLARSLGFSLSRKRSFSLTMIGMLFNAAVPGSVGGDLLKAYYARGESADGAGAVASILADRAVGLFSLICLAVAGTAWNYEELVGNPVLRSLWYMLAALMLIAIVGSVLAIAASERMASLLESFQIYPPIRAVLIRALGILSAYKRKKSVLLQGVALSLPCHLLACAAFYLALGAVSNSAPNPGLLLFVVPLGLATTALPVSPGGIGIGQAAFYTLFRWMLPGQGSLGSDAFTIYQMVLLSVSLSGIVFYVRYTRTAVPPATASVPAAVPAQRHDSGG